ncbi:YgaP family membrane protein [Methylobacillus glycogenes]|uniref:YgaP family membrane protein n=1 Tax=Methylobacillus glycogenes TaxID=406 RepID=UPI000472F80E|nr:DUF2892 domain-containing protein [Methylobacillus glycogenes]
MSHVDLEINDQLDRVRRSTSDEINAEIDRKTERNIAQYSALGEEAIKNRVQALDAEWDIERVLEVNASTLALTGVALGALVNKKWLWLSAGVLGFLLQHGIQGWCPPLPVLRRMGIRTAGKLTERNTHCWIN